MATLRQYVKLVESLRTSSNVIFIFQRYNISDINHCNFESSFTTENENIVVCKT